MSLAKPAQPQAIQDSFTAAATTCHVPVGILKLWLIENAPVGKEMWSHWKVGREPIAPKHLFAFMAAWNGGWRPEGWPG